MAVIFSDTFVEASNTDLHLHTPNVGTSWSVLWQTTSTDKYVVIATSDTVSQSGAGSSGAMYTADATYGSADYEVKATVATLGASATASYYLLARIQDQENMYAYRQLGPSGDTNGGRIYKKVAGTWTLLGTAFVGATTLDVVTLEVSGTTIRVLYNGVEQRSVTDSDITGAGKAGLGLGGGAELVASSDDPASQTDLDDFEVNTLGAAVDLVVQDATHAHTADSQSLTQAHNLTVEEALHGHTADTQALTQVHELAVADAAHAHTAAESTLTQVHLLAIAEALHTHTADNVTLSAWAAVKRRSTSPVARRSTSPVKRRGA